MPFSCPFVPAVSDSSVEIPASFVPMSVLGNSQIIATASVDNPILTSTNMGSYGGNASAIPSQDVGKPSFMHHLQTTEQLSKL